ncbi:MAG: nucleotide sugar dehydrogenase [Candidatus Sericytochromatia bacterium]|nr:nucleotide sugar dehydrogenase [Candidatus Sericytochromatia bacterium]
MQTTVAVIGGGGHVGLGLSLLLADTGHSVVGIDTNVANNARIMAGDMPFKEEGAAPVLKRVLESGRFTIHDDHAAVSAAEVVIVILGTPIDSNLNPDLKPLRQAMATIAPFLRPGQIVMLRSTIAPGTTDTLRRMLEDLTGLTVGQDIDLVFAPERVIQGKALSELPLLPQLIGAFDDAAYARTEAFFLTFLRSRCFQLSPTEAEMGKLMTNMFRYVQFALANEFQMLADMHGANVFKIIDACNHDYPRLRIPDPGPNVGGPCLFKDGWFLLEGVAFNEIIATAFRINESMPAQIRQRLAKVPTIRRVAVLGMTFKANSDDTRNSLSFKLCRILENTNYEVVRLDPMLSAHSDWQVLDQVDAVVLMTPHDCFAELATIRRHVGRDDVLYADLWGFWREMRYCSANGYFWGHDIPH